MKLVMYPLDEGQLRRLLKSTKTKKSPFIPMICETSNVFQQKNEMYRFLFEEEKSF